METFMKRNNLEVTFFFRICTYFPWDGSDGYGDDDGRGGFGGGFSFGDAYALVENFVESTQNHSLFLSTKQKKTTFKDQKVRFLCNNVLMVMHALTRRDTIFITA